MSKNIGKVVQVMGPVLDIRFEEGQLPRLLNSIEIETESGKLTSKEKGSTSPSTVASTQSVSPNS